jgi:hypothetical protein
MIFLASREQVAVTPAAVAAGYHSFAGGGAHPGYYGLATNWDGQWYWQIAQQGYPSNIEIGPTGQVERNAWAFPPLFPLLTRAVMFMTGLDFPVAAVGIATLCSLGGVLLAFRLIEETAGREAARVTTLLLCTSMAAASFQIGYTEGVALLFLTAALHALRKERYLLTAFLLWGLGLSRHVVLPFLAVIAVHAVRQWQMGLLTPRRVRTLTALAASTLSAGLAWPAIAAIVTGRLNALTDTQAAWRKSEDVGSFGVFSVAWRVGGMPWLLCAVGAALVIVLAVLGPWGRGWSPEVRAWALAYPIYVLAVAPAALSLIRFWLLAFPLAWCIPAGLGRSRFRYALVAVLAIAGLLVQWYWIRHFLVLGPVEEQFAMP